MHLQNEITPDAGDKTGCWLPDQTTTSELGDTAEAIAGLRIKGSVRCGETIP